MPYELTRKYRLILGMILIAGGISVIADYYLGTRWVKLMVVFLSGLYFLVEGVRTRQMGFLVAGSILSSLTAGLWLAYIGSDVFSLKNQTGAFLALFAVGWLLIPLLSARFALKKALWALVPGGALAAVGAWLLQSPARAVDLLLYLAAALALAFLVWGMYERLFGLVIPGCLLLGIGAGVYNAWGATGEPNGLVRIGMMLVWFAFGWGLIVLFGRVLMDKLIWWPLIPAGVLAMAGWGLYIGGNPENALYFISNSGSVGLIIIGLYLLLLRRGIQ